LAKTRSTSGPRQNRITFQKQQNGKTAQIDVDDRDANPTATGGKLAPARFRGDFIVIFGAPFQGRDWADGANHPNAIAVRTRPSLLYDRLFSVSSDFAPQVLRLLGFLAILFGIIVLIALLIGMRITRTITGAIHKLYRATQHVNRGDFSHRISVTSKDQLAALESSFNSMTESVERLLIEQKQKERLENELAIAQEVQNQLFPRSATGLASLELNGICRPARTVSGDYYDFIPFGNEQLVLAVGDISGKGISAALLMATIHSAVRAYEFGRVAQPLELAAAGSMAPGQSYADSSPGSDSSNHSTAEVMWLLNRHLYRSTPMEKYATMFLGLYDGRSRTLSYSNAGHLPPLLLDARGNVRRLEHGGTVIGLFEDVRYDEARVEMHPGEIFVAFSDGITEPENEFGEFGEERLIELIQENHDLPLARISEIVTTAVQDWIGGAEQPDDVTLVLARAI
jgi:sigma-B regulation protein RsbU (phosphoserine phosphatase)